MSLKTLTFIYISTSMAEVDVINSHLASEMQIFTDVEVAKKNKSNNTINKYSDTYMYLYCLIGN